MSVVMFCIMVILIRVIIIGITIKSCICISVVSTACILWGCRGMYHWFFVVDIPHG